MKSVVALLLLLLGLLQYALWLGEGGVFDVWQLNRTISAQEEENAKLKERNATMEAEVKDLKQGLEAIEERARSELGMTKKDETFYQTVEE